MVNFFLFVYFTELSLANSPVPHTPLPPLPTCIILFQDWETVLLTQPSFLIFWMLTQCLLGNYCPSFPIVW